jgi:hypothetical protein
MWITVQRTRDPAHARHISLIQLGPGCVIGALTNHLIGPTADGEEQSCLMTGARMEG